MQLPRGASRRYRTAPGYGAWWVHTSSALANNTSYVHLPPLATSVSRITYFLAMFIRYCTSSALEGSHASSLSCTQGRKGHALIGRNAFAPACAARRTILPKFVNSAKGHLNVPDSAALVSHPMRRFVFTNKPCWLIIPPSRRASDGMAEASDDLDLVLGDFPPVSYAFAYGSGVFRQRNYSDKQASSAMTDVVLAVEDPEAWHAENLARNREHYSGLAWFGPSAIAAVQRRGAGLYFNPYARVSSGRLLKYGVVSRSVLEDDLSHWNSLYVAGRMHKPVRVLRDHADTAALAAANHRSALTAALLMLPAEFTEDELYLEVSSAPLHFRTSAPPRLRAPHLCSRAAVQPCSRAAVQPCSPAARVAAAQLLPACVCRWPG